MQAAVRGHLVRRQAVGTLRCVQAIVKMQILVRARHTNRIAEESSIKEKLKVSIGKIKSMKLYWQYFCLKHKLE